MNYEDWLKNRKVIQISKIMPKKLKMYILKMHKGARIWKENQKFSK